jgi:type I pantothenate kinase
LIPEGFDPPREFEVFDRAEWGARFSGPTPGTPRGEVVDPVEWREWHVPLGHFIARARPVEGRPMLVGVAGSVAVGKSTFANSLAGLFDDAAVISTDGFLLPNAILGARAGFKGFPDTYDQALFTDTLTRLAAGETVTIPRYSHEVYDIAGPPHVVAPASVVIIEGINALSPLCAVGIYLDAAEPDVRAWYVARFLEHIDAARADPSSFFAKWTGLSEAAARDLAVSVWEMVNLVNLEEHILPTRWTADVVVRKGANHLIEAIAVRAG